MKSKKLLVLAGACALMSFGAQAKSALIIVDMQNCFMETGSLPVKGGTSIVDGINQLAEKTDLVVATKDWHPAGHKSFASAYAGKNPFDSVELNGLAQTLWPDHCVQGTKGAELVEGLTRDIDYTQLKGQDLEREFYSGFMDTTGTVETELKAYLEREKVTELYVVGVATDFCVKSTAIDAQKLGFKTHVVQDLTKAAIDFDKAIVELKDNGVEVVNSSEILK